MERQRAMPAEALVELLSTLEEAGIETWLDGGWGVDALLERQTRPHKDIDLIVRVSDVPALRAALAAYGFAVIEGIPPHAFVLADGAGREVDIHAVTFDAKGDGVYRRENGTDWTFPAGGFCGRGSIAGREVACLTPEVQVLCHAHGYTPIEKDFADMEALRTRFGVALPPSLQRPRAR